MQTKSSVILRVNGNMITSGTYTSSDGTEVKFTPELIRKIFSKVKDHVPYYITHEGAPIVSGAKDERVPVGYAYKVGLSDDSSETTHEGFVFDAGAKQRVSSDCDNVSPEIDFVTDDDGNVIDGTLTGLAFVPNPAINGTNVASAATVFSRQTKKNSSTEGNMPEDDLNVQLEAARKQALKFSDDLEAEKKSHRDTQLKFEAEQQKNKELFEKYTDLLNEQVKAHSLEVKSLGFAKPEELVNGLEPEAAIQVLVGIKKQFSAPGMKAPEQKISGGSSNTTTEDDVKKARFSAMEELGFTEEDFKHIQAKEDE